MGLFYVLQLGPPLLLVAWLWLFPPDNRLTLILLAAAAASWIVAAELVGLWLVVPRWLTSVLGLAVVLGAGRAWIRRQSRMFPPGPREWLWPVLCLLLAGFGGLFIAEWFKAHDKPAGAVVDLARPLGKGTYLLANGGNSPTLNAHFMTLDQSVARFRPYLGQSMAIDIVRLNNWGRTTNRLRPVNPASYKIFGDPVFAPCSGSAVAARDGRPDMPVPQMDRTVMLGNHVILSCGEYHVVLAHFRRGSVRVRSGDPIKAGQLIAEVGNSGNSAEPHLHLHVQRPGTWDEPVSGAPVPLTIDGRFLVRNDVL